MLGRGGNGEVFDVKIHNKSAELLNADRYVVKCLTFQHGMRAKKNGEREERFRREVEVVSTKLKNIEGVIPVLDSSYANNNVTHPYQWYLMPKA